MGSLAKKVFLDSKNRITIPKNFRRYMNLSEGRELLVTYKKGKLILELPGFNYKNDFKKYQKKFKDLVKMEFIVNG